MGLGAVFVLMVSSTAHAYCRTTTITNEDASYNASVNGCWKPGVPLWWRNACVGYSIQREGAKQIAYDEVSTIIAEAFTRWTGATCPIDEVGRARPSIDVRDIGPAECSKVELAPFPSPNQNVIIFRQDWPHKKVDPTRTVLGLTRVQYLANSGEILGADMELNMADIVPFKTSEPLGGNDYDLLSVITHEAGHFLGLAHSDVPYATMHSDVQRGQSYTRRLTPDDIAGICEAYRPNGDRPVLDKKVTDVLQCNPMPRGGFSSECAEPPSSCGMGRRRTSAFEAVLPLLALALALLSRSPRRFPCRRRSLQRTAGR